MSMAFDLQEAEASADYDSLVAPEGSDLEQFPRAEHKSRNQIARMAAKTSELSAKQSTDALCGTWLDEGLRLCGPEGATLLEQTLGWVDAIGRNRRSQRRHHRANFESRVECFLANALRGRFYRTSDRIAYHTGNNDYLVRNRNLEGRWFSAASIRQDIALLEEAGLVQTQSGIWAGSVNGWESGRATTYRSTAQLNDLFRKCGVHRRSIWQPLPPAKSLIRLREAEDFDGKKRELRFDWATEHSTWAEKLDSYNRFVIAHDVWIDGLSTKEERRLIAWQNRKLEESSRQPGYTQLEDFNLHLRRIFNDGTFEHGGRLYGAWYQLVPQWLRKRIAIDDIKTVELDFSGMAVRMLYHKAGIDYLDDPYALPELEAYAEARNQPTDRYRASVKTLVQAMLNNEDDEIRAEMAKVDLPFPRKFTRARVREMILSRHEAIQSYFGSGVGKRLQRLDSDIALDVISSLMDEEIVCLPIHDSFIVVDTHREKLQSAMMSSYQQRLGYPPIIN